MNFKQFVEISPCNNSPLPHPRSGHRAVVTDSDLWIWGGYHPAGTATQEPRMFNELWRFNFALRQWKLEQTTGDGPTQTLASHAMCLFRHYMFVFGGTGYPFGQTISNALYLLDLKRLHWKRCQLTGDEPQSVYGASMLVKDDHMYLLCGTNRWTYNTDVYEINLPRLTCTKIGHTFDEMEDFIDGGRYRQEAFLHDNRIFLFGGGGASGISFSFENIPMFDISKRTWSFVQTNPDPVENFPHARKFHSIFPFGDNQIVMFGGAYFDLPANDHALVNDRLWLFNLKRFEWTIVPTLKMVRPIYFHAAAMNDRGEIWTHGGVIAESDDNGNPRRVTTIYKMDSRVQNLSEMCWNLFLKSLSDRYCLVEQVSSLSKLPIPSRFFDRIH